MRMPRPLDSSRSTSRLASDSSAEPTPPPECGRRASVQLDHRVRRAAALKTPLSMSLPASLPELFSLLRVERLTDGRSGAGRGERAATAWKDVREKTPSKTRSVGPAKHNVSTKKKGPQPLDTLAPYMYRTHIGPAKRRSPAAGSNGSRKAQAPPGLGGIQLYLKKSNSLYR